MTSHSQPDQPGLLILAPQELCGRLISLSGGDLIVGRGESADVRLDDPYVSRTHAVLLCRGPQVLVQDLGSTGGTTVNGQPAVAATPLVPGDVVRFADVEMEFHAGTARNETTALPAIGPAFPPPKPPAASQARDGSAAVSRFDLHDQRAGAINNVGRDQYHSYVAHVRQERESFLREVAATKTKARHLVWSGLTFYAIGLALGGYAILRTMARVSDSLGSARSAPPNFRDFFGTPVFGIPLGLLGAGLNTIGIVLLIFGVTFHVVASARRRRVDRDLPSPHP